EVPPVPSVAVRDQGLRRVALFGEANLLIGADAIQHVYLDLGTFDAKSVTETTRALHQFDVMRAEHETKPSPLDLRQHEYAKCEIVRVDGFPGCVRSVRRLCVRALDEPDGRLDLHEPDDVFHGPVQVCLQADAGARMVRPQLDVKVEGRLCVSASFHVDPQEAPRFGGGPGKTLEVGVSHLRVGIEGAL